MIVYPAILENTALDNEIVMYAEADPRRDEPSNESVQALVQGVWLGYWIAECAPVELEG